MYRAIEADIGMYDSILCVGMWVFKHLTPGAEQGPQAFPEGC